MGKGKKKQKSLEIVLDDEFYVNSAAIGAKLVDFDLWPDFSECIFFHENFEDKLYSNVQHLLDNRQERKNYHPHHHLYVGEILMKLGFAALGRTFETVFSDELGFYRTLFKEYMSLQPDIYKKYTGFRKNGLQERLDALKKHCLKGYIKVKKSDLLQMKDTIELMGMFSAKDRSEIKDRHEKQKYDAIFQLKEDFYEMAALFKGVVI
ncbi:hypothetical protein KY312_03935 [Candidatus Woesearchaeota archaeon]|nr:hypothetical protein [Candidatus Woesearchaeota archaeon]